MSLQGKLHVVVLRDASEGIRNECIWGVHKVRYDVFYLGKREHLHSSQGLIWWLLDFCICPNGEVANRLVSKLSLDFFHRVHLPHSFLIWLLFPHICLFRFINFHTCLKYVQKLFPFTHEVNPDLSMEAQFFEKKLKELFGKPSLFQKIHLLDGKSLVFYFCLCAFYFCTSILLPCSWANLDIPCYKVFMLRFVILLQMYNRLSFGTIS